ncbi:MAG: VWA domain-containing protein, partial [Holophagales bacterium]|nr:VWA domain-containing protein [Holophagales bacterium]
MGGRSVPTDPASPAKDQSLETALGSFVNAWENVRSDESSAYGALAVPDDRLAVVLFDSNASTASVTPGLSAFDEVDDSVESLDVVPGGATSIGDGLLEASSLLPAAAGASRQVILLMSDGKQNTDALVGVSSGAGEVFTHPPGDPSDRTPLPGLGNYEIYSVTAGAGTAVSAQINEDLALATGGAYINSEVDASLLSAFFRALLQNFLEFNTWQTVATGRGRVEYRGDTNPDGAFEVTRDDPFPFQVPISSTATSLLIQLDRHGSRKGDLCLRPTTPSGVALDEVCGIVTGSTWSLGVNELAAGLPGGNWRFEVGVRAGETTTSISAEVAFTVLVDDLGIHAEMSLPSDERRAGFAIPVEVQLEAFGAPIRDLPTEAVRLRYTRPGQTLGDLLSDSQESTAEPFPADALGAADARLLATLSKAAPSRVGNDELLLDDGVAPDRVQGDGIYTTDIVVAEYGHTDLLVTVDADTEGAGPLRRQWIESVYLRPVPDEGASQIEVEDFPDSLPGPVAQPGIRILFTPRTSAGHRLGPGWQGYFWATAPGLPAAKAVDNLDGTYTIDMPYSGQPPRPTLHFVPDSVVIPADVTVDKLPRPLGTGTAFAPEVGSGGRLGWSLGVQAGVAEGQSWVGGSLSSGFAFQIELERGLPILAPAGNWALAFLAGRSEMDVGAGLGRDLEVDHASVELRFYGDSGAWHPVVGAGVGGYDPSGSSAEGGANVLLGLQWDSGSRLALDLTGR